MAVYFFGVGWVRQRQKQKQVPFGDDKQKNKQRQEQKPIRRFFASLRMTAVERCRWGACGRLL